MADVASIEFDCPVCCELFKIPKILPCFHVVCRDCIITWLKKTGGLGECPICRAPVLSATSQGQGQVEIQVDRLPTDLATEAFAESHRILTGPHKCHMCPNNVAGQGFCLQCCIKLCTACTLYHQQLPASKDHSVQQISRLTVSQLAACHVVKCKFHADKEVELYCTSHEELICLHCAATAHRGCLEVKEIRESAREQRQKLKDRLERMKAEQVNIVKEKSKAMHKKAEDVFDDLVQSIEKRRNEVSNLIQAEENALLAQVEKEQVSTALPCRKLENLLSKSPDGGLLVMQQQLVSHLDKLESQLKVKDDTDSMDKDCLVLDGQIIMYLKSDLAKLGQLQPTCRQPTSTPVAAATTVTRATVSGQMQRPHHHYQPTLRPAAATATTMTRARVSDELVNDAESDKENLYDSEDSDEEDAGWRPVLQPRRRSIADYLRARGIVRPKPYYHYTGRDEDDEDEDMWPEDYKSWYSHSPPTSARGSKGPGLKRLRSCQGRDEDEDMWPGDYTSRYRYNPPVIAQGSRGPGPKRPAGLQGRDEDMWPGDYTSRYRYNRPVTAQGSRGPGPERPGVRQVGKQKPNPSFRGI